jgi:tRNA threonylcarbamoyladenosine biosynthesis protein TsaE
MVLISGIILQPGCVLLISGLLVASRRQVFRAGAYICGMEWVFSIENISGVALALWKAIPGKKVLALHGSMGAGKTTFIHALCDVLGVKDVVGSPTFSIINEYRYQPADAGNTGTGQSLFHMDLYRIRDEEEAIRTGVEDALYSGNICLVEWPEKAPAIFPADTVHVWIEVLDDKTRRLKITDI